MSNVQVGVVVSKFTFLTNSHVTMLKKAASDNDFVIIAVGSSDRARSIEYPFSFDERVMNIKELIQNDDSLSSMSYRVISLPDSPYNQYNWTNSIHGSIYDVLDELNITCDEINVYTFKSKQYHYETIFPEPSFVLAFVPNKDETVKDSFFYGGGRIKELAKVCPPSFVNFAIEFMNSDVYKRLLGEYNAVEHMIDSWESSPFPPSFVTTDAVVYCKGHILLVTRNNPVGKGLYCLPGGFLNQHATITDGIVDNLKKDTAIKVSKPILKSNIVKSSVFDDPFRSPRGRIITHVGLIVLDNVTSLYTLPDVREVKGQKTHAKWIPVHMIDKLRDQFFEDHYYIIKSMLTSIDAQ